MHAFSTIWSVPGRKATAGVAGPLQSIGAATVGSDASSGDASSASRRASMVSGVASSSTALMARITDASGSTVSSFWLSTARAWAVGRDLCANGYVLVAHRLASGDESKHNQADSEEGD